MNSFSKMVSLGMIGLGLMSGVAHASVSGTQLMELTHDVVDSVDWLVSHMPAQRALSGRAGALQAKVWLAQNDGRVTESELAQVRHLVRNIRVAVLPLRERQLSDFQSLALTAVLNSTRSFMNRTRAVGGRLAVAEEAPVVVEVVAPVEQAPVVEEEATSVVVIIEESPETEEAPAVEEAPVVEETPAAIVEAPAVEETPAVQEAQ